MEQQTQSPKFHRQRKFFMVLPVLVLPFVTLFFWALGGGKAQDLSLTRAQKGFNMSLPDAYLKEDKPLDKMSYYNKAASDSARLKQLMKNDPYYQLDSRDISQKKKSSLSMSNLKRKSSGISSPNNKTTYQDPNEAKVYQKLDQLNTALENASNVPETNSIESYPTSSNASMNKTDIDRLEQMMHLMNQPGGEDPEMHQINDMIEKILDIQHPERVQSKINKASQEQKGQVMAVSSTFEDDPVSLMDNSPPYIWRHDSISQYKIIHASNDFYSLDEVTALSNAPNAIEAVVHETQTLVNNSTVKLRLVSDVNINGVLIPKDNFLFGTAALNGERLKITINSIHFENHLFPVELSVYDLDGMIGIYIPGAITRDVAKQSADRAVQSINLNSLDASVGAQAANAGIEAAKNLFSKKVKLIKVTVKAGYQVLLLDEKQNKNF